MNFASVKHALQWFFNRDFERPPLPLRSPSMIYFGTAYNPEDGEAVYKAYQSIRSVLECFTIRDLRVLEAAFLRSDKTNSQRASECGIRSRHSYWYVKTRLIQRLEGAFVSAGIISPPKSEPPVYAK